MLVINQNELFFNYISDGLYQMHSDEIINILDIDTFGDIVDVDEFIDDKNKSTLFNGIYASDYSDDQKNRLTKLRQYVESTVLEPYTVQTAECGIWDGVDEGSRKFHNDNQFGGMNCSVLCYFDDTSPETGGALYVAPTFERDKYVKVYPKKGTIVLLNQSKSFCHKADPSINRRTVVGFDYLIKEFPV